MQTNIKTSTNEATRMSSRIAEIRDINVIKLNPLKASASLSAWCGFMTSGGCAIFHNRHGTLHVSEILTVKVSVLFI